MGRPALPLRDAGLGAVERLHLPRAPLTATPCIWQVQPSIALVTLLSRRMGVTGFRSFASGSCCQRSTPIRSPAV